MTIPPKSFSWNLPFVLLIAWFVISSIFGFLMERYGFLQRAYAVQDGLIIVNLIVLFALSSWSVRRSRSKQKKGYCPICDYDLRATPDRCPECGFSENFEMPAADNSSSQTKFVRQPTPEEPSKTTPS